MSARMGVLLVALAAAGCATAPPDPDAREGRDLALAPYAAHEQCLALRPGDRLDYRFHSSVPLAFDIHYKEAHAVVMPLRREGVTADSGIYQPVLAQTFCLAWEAGAQAARLDYRIGVRRRAP